MSYYAYKESQRIAAEDHSFDALIMAALRKADSTNFEKLYRSFPEISRELQARYDASGGCIGDELLPVESERG